MKRITQAFAIFQMVFLTMTLNAQVQVVELQNQDEKMDQLMRDFNARNDYHKPVNDFLGMKVTKDKSACKKIAAQNKASKSKTTFSNSIPVYLNGGIDSNKDRVPFFRNTSIEYRRTESDEHMNRISW